MRVVILQPGYLPWIGYFDQMKRADLFVHATDLQYTRQDWRSRNRIKTRNGGWQWLTVPVQSKGNYYARIHEIRINNAVPWARKHLNLLRENYRKAPWFDRYFPLFEAAYSQTWDLLLDLDLFFIDRLKAELGITTPCLDIRDLELGDSLDRVERILSVCRKLGATAYLSGDAGRQYLNHSLLDPHGIALEFHEMQHPVYPQLHAPFMPYLSAVDLLFNCGPDSARYLHPFSAPSQPDKTHKKP